MKNILKINILTKVTQWVLLLLICLLLGKLSSQNQWIVLLAPSGDVCYV